MNRILMAAAIAALGVTCCQAAPNNTKRTNGFVDTTENAVPPNYRELVARYLKDSLVDPNSLRDVGISEPAVRRVGIFHGGRRPAVCVRYDAKNPRGLYTGASSTVYYFKGGQVVGAARRQAFCSDASYSPFPEADPHAAIARRAPVEHARPATGKSKASGAKAASKASSSKGSVKAVPTPAPAKSKSSEADFEGRPYDEGPRTYYDARHGDTWYRQRS